MDKILKEHFDKFMSQGKLPPEISEDEQSKLVQQIESKFSIIEKLEEAVNQALNKSVLLKKSILKAAFEGKLIRTQSL